MVWHSPLLSVTLFVLSHVLLHLSYYCEVSTVPQLHITQFYFVDAYLLVVQPHFLWLCQSYSIQFHNTQFPHHLHLTLMFTALLPSFLFFVLFPSSLPLICSSYSSGFKYFVLRGRKNAVLWPTWGAYLVFFILVLFPQVTFPHFSCSSQPLPVSLHHFYILFLRLNLFVASPNLHTWLYNLLPFFFFFDVSRSSFRLLPFFITPHYHYTTNVDDSSLFSSLYLISSSPYFIFLHRIDLLMLSFGTHNGTVLCTPPP